MSRAKQQPFVSIIVPSYKQEKSIVSNVRQLHQALSPTGYNYEILVVLDGSVDNSFQKLHDAQIPKTTVLSYGQNRGKGYAIRLGMSRAQGENVLFIDAGMEIDPEGITMVLLHLQWYKADIVVGSKRHMASLVNYSFQRRILSMGYYFLVKLLFGVRVSDTQAGIKVFRCEVLKAILPRLLEKRFASDLEMLVVARKLGYTQIFEAPIKLDYHLAGLSSAATVQSILNILVDTFAIFYRARLSNYYSSVQHRTRDPEDLQIFSVTEN